MPPEPLSEFVRALTAFRFVAAVTELTGEYADFGGAYFTQWLLHGADGTALAAIAPDPLSQRFGEALAVGQSYVFCGGALCHEFGPGIALCGGPAQLFCVFTRQTRVLAPSARAAKGATPVGELVARAARCEFAAVVEHWTPVERTIDPARPAFRAALADERGGRVRLDAVACGEAVCANVHPALGAHERLAFAGGVVKMEYTQQSLYVEWGDRTAVAREVNGWALYR
jgi:hypothetical protein